MPSYAQVAALAALAAPSLVSAHGYVSGVVSGSKYYSGSSPNWAYESSKPNTAGWFANNQDNGFVAPSTYSTGDITCHKNATNGMTDIPVTAGESIDLQWSTWPDSHHGPVITYLANCGDSCETVDKSTLKFFKIHAGGLEDGSASPGKWATDTLIANNFTATVDIPADIASGNYVMRHEIIALHSAGSADGAQNYPQCLNVKLTSSSTTAPCSAGAECVAGTALYKEDDAGILINIYQTLSSYTIPGPKLYGSTASNSSSKAKRTGVKWFAWMNRECVRANGGRWWKG